MRATNSRLNNRKGLVDVNNKYRHSDSRGSVPRWVRVTAVATGAVTLAFLMVIVVLSGTGKIDVQRLGFPFVAFLGIAMCLLTALFGFEAVARGKLPLPYISGYPLHFGVGGGLAAFVIVLVVGSTLLPKSPSHFEDECSIAMPQFLTLEAAARTIASSDEASVRFHSCSDSVMDASIHGGPVSAVNCLALMKNLKDRVRDHSVLPHMKVSFDELGARYEITCTS